MCGSRTTPYQYKWCPVGARCRYMMSGLPSPGNGSGVGDVKWANNLTALVWTITSPFISLNSTVLYSLNTSSRVSVKTHAHQPTQPHTRPRAHALDEPAIRLVTFDQRGCQYYRRQRTTTRHHTRRERYLHAHAHARTRARTHTHIYLYIYIGPI